MKHIPTAPLAAFALLLATPLAVSQEPAAPPDPGAPPPAPVAEDDLVVPEWKLEYDSLSDANKEQYLKHLVEADRLFKQKRIFETLNEVAQAEKVFDQGPALLNLKGACYVEFRNFERAREIFARAYDLQKVYLDGIEEVNDEQRRKRMEHVLDILFNIAEMDFVMGNWQECHERLETILPAMAPRDVGMSRLVEFKLMLCKVKLGRLEEARELAEKYDYLDDNPYYYYANAAIAYHDGDKEAAERWRASARKVFRNPAALAPWEDTMIEFGYIKSFYGGDLFEE